MVPFSFVFVESSTFISSVFSSGGEEEGGDVLVEVPQAEKKIRQDIARTAVRLFLIFMMASPFGGKF